MDLPMLLLEMLVQEGLDLIHCQRRHRPLGCVFIPVYCGLKVVAGLGNDQHFDDAL